MSSKRARCPAGVEMQDIFAEGTACPPQAVCDLWISVSEQEEADEVD